MEKTPMQPQEAAVEAPTHHLRTGRKVRKLLRPDGRRIHIAASPEEHLRLSRTLPNIEPDDNFEIHIHGSVGHLDAVRELHTHHEQRREHLRNTHGNFYDEVEHVKTELDILANELHQLTDHGVSLDANFSKFGYDAHIRTRDPDSSASSFSEHHEKRDWDAERRKGKSVKFWARPVVRQYWHKGLLWRASEVEEVASFELFIDLLYVGIIAVIGDKAAEDPTGFGFLRFAITFILGWKMWSELTQIISWFDDIFQRVQILFVMTCLFGYTLNIVQSFEATYVQLIAFYLAQRLFSVIHFMWVGHLLPMIRGYMIVYSVTIVVPAALWIASIQVDYPNRLALIWVAIFVDLFSVLGIVWLKRWVDTERPGFMSRFRDWFDFFPAINIEHKTERTNAFVTLVFGYSVVSLLFQNKAPFGINAFFGKAVLGLIQAFSFNWMYFEIDSWNLHTHAIRRHIMSSIVWMMAHLPFIMGYVLAAASLSRLVLTTDCHDANIEDLTDAYVSKSQTELPTGLRWFYCAGLGIALLCMTIISLCHVHKEFDGQRISKRYRVSVRTAVAIILIFLPLADKLNSLHLISTTTSLVVLVLMLEVYGSTSVHEAFWRRTSQCKYRADCPVKKKDITDAMKTGATIKLEEVRTGDSGEKGIYHMI